MKGCPPLGSGYLGPFSHFMSERISKKRKKPPSWSLCWMALLMAGGFSMSKTGNFWSLPKKKKMCLLRRVLMEGNLNSLCLETRATESSIYCTYCFSILCFLFLQCVNHISNGCHPAIGVWSGMHNASLVPGPGNIHLEELYTWFLGKSIKSGIRKLPN